MREASGTIARAREIVLASAAAVAVSLVMTWPLAADLGGQGRTFATDADGLFSIWNTAWVAHTIVTNPLHLYDANIFHPHSNTLAYSEANVLPGLVGVIPYFLTHNPWLTQNIVLLFGFSSGYLCAFLLLRYLTQDPGAAAAGAVLYAFCPYVFSHLSHTQLLMTGGIPLSILMLHRVADGAATGGADAGPRRTALIPGLWLGLALAAQALSCAYYGIFAALIVGYGTLFFAASRRLWRSPRYWTSIVTGAIVSVVVVMPFFLPYLSMQNESGFTRTMDDAVRWAARPHDYLVSSAFAHKWLLDFARQFGPWTEVLFPGMVALVLGLVGIGFALRRHATREPAIFYGTLGVLALWASFGPAAGLYRLLFHLPAFSFLRAPSRLGLVVVLCLTVFAAFTLRDIFERAPGRRTLLASVAGLIAVADLIIVPLRWFRAPDIPAPYSVLAASPRGVLAEFPFYGERIAMPLHTQYMLFSTAHWMPMLNGYSDVIPSDFRAAAPVLATFPSDDAVNVLAKYRVRYWAVHWDMFPGDTQADVRERMQRYLRLVRVLASDERVTIYEVNFYP